MTMSHEGVKTGMRTLGAAAVAWTVALTAASLAAQAPRSVNEGVYTSAQARRGEATFTSICTTCHDTARFTGPDFVSAWSGKSLAGLFEAVQSMPEDNPGSLTAQQYADVIAYFLQLNEYPTGSSELAGEEDAMKAIGMDAHKP
ncbi:MAG: c-type cytochrome [Vicinamibacterales bacterium]